MKLSELQSRKIKTYVGFAYKSRTCIVGTDNILSARKYDAVLIDSTLSENASEKIKRHAEEQDVQVVTIDDFGEIAPKVGVKALAIKNKDLAKAIAETLGENK